MSDSSIPDQVEAESEQVKAADEQSPGEQPRQNGFLTRWLVRIGVVLLLVALALGGVCWYVYRAAQVIPDYYQAILEQPKTELDVAGDQFESELLELKNSAVELGTWQAVFGQDQINGWLGYDLPQKFPDSLPPSITNPRVLLKQDELRIVFRYESEQLTGIVECCCDLFCTQEINEIAMRIKFIRSGVLNLPIQNWSDEITKIFQANGLQTQWFEEEGDPMVLVRLPTLVNEDSEQRIVIESLDLLDGKVVLQGVTMDEMEFGDYEVSRLADPKE